VGQLVCTQPASVRRCGDALRVRRADRRDHRDAAGRGRVPHATYDRLLERIDPNGKRRTAARCSAASCAPRSERSTSRHRYEHIERPAHAHADITEITVIRSLGRRALLDPTWFATSRRPERHVLTERASEFETITWNYDELGRPRTRRGTSLRYRAAAAIVWQYDTTPHGIGLLAVRYEDVIHNYRVLDYDALGRATREQYTLTVANNRRPFVFDNSYDPLGQLLSRKHPTGTLLSFTRDPRGYLTNISSGAGAADASAIQWSADGRLTSWTGPGGVVTTALRRRLATPGCVAGRRTRPGAARRPRVSLRRSRSRHERDRRRRRSQRRRRLRPARSTGSQHPTGGGRVARSNERVRRDRQPPDRDATGPDCGGTRPHPSPQRPAPRDEPSATEGGGAASVTTRVARLTLGNRRFYYNAFARLTEVWDGGTPRC
jgi:YD repeat-containing protein